MKKKEDDLDSIVTDELGMRDIVLRFIDTTSSKLEQGMLNFGKKYQSAVETAVARPADAFLRGGATKEQMIAYNQKLKSDPAFFEEQLQPAMDMAQNFLPGVGQLNELKPATQVGNKLRPLAEAGVKNLEKLGAEKAIRQIPEFGPVTARGLAENAVAIGDDIVQGAKRLIGDKKQAVAKTAREILRKKKGEIGAGQFQGSRIIR